MQQKTNQYEAGFYNSAKDAFFSQNSLQAQLNQLCHDYVSSSCRASHAARTLQYEGQVRKPLLRKKMDCLKDEIQLTLEFEELN